MLAIWTALRDRTPSGLRISIPFGLVQPLGSALLAPHAHELHAWLRQLATYVCAALIVGLACGVITLLFLVQQFGTGAIGFLFSPVILTWLMLNLGAPPPQLQHSRMLSFSSFACRATAEKRGLPPCTSPKQWCTTWSSDRCTDLQLCSTARSASLPALRQEVVPGRAEHRQQ